MADYDRILIPTDGSEGAEVAVDHAAIVAEKFDAEVHVLYVVDVRAKSTKDMLSAMIGKFREVGEEATDEIVGQLEDRNLVAKKEVTEGVPHKEINGYVQENDIDLVVMGTHGRTGVDRVLLGSTTEKVMRTSEVPVMTVSREDS